MQTGWARWTIVTAFCVVLAASTTACSPHTGSQAVPPPTPTTASDPGIGPAGGTSGDPSSAPLTSAPVAASSVSTCPLPQASVVLRPVHPGYPVSKALLGCEGVVVVQHAPPELGMRRGDRAEIQVNAPLRLGTITLRPASTTVSVDGDVIEALAPGTVDLYDTDGLPCGGGASPADTCRILRIVVG